MMCTPMGLTGSCKPSCYGVDDYCYLNCDY
jgi:hypothetical protein